MATIIGVMSDQPVLESVVPETFADSKFLIILDFENGNIHHIEERGEGGDRALAQKVVEFKCEALVTGPISTEPFLIIADEGQCSRLNGAGLPISEAMWRFQDNQLEYMKDSIEGTTCDTHGHGSDRFCDDHDHDHHHHN